MSRPTLTVVIPAYNSRAHIGGTIAALVEAASRSPFQTDVVLVDDGSTDGTADAAVAACTDRLPLNVISQANQGRFEARRAGLDAATADWVLLLDSRVTLEPGSLAFVAERLQHDERIWNGHVHVRTEGNPFGAFWNVLVRVAWKDYLGDPRATSFGLEDFDRFPKGTSCFLAPKSVLIEAVDSFRSYYADLRVVSDDTAVIRHIAEHDRIHLSPEFACDYEARTTLNAFFKQGVYRGTTFVDGHLRPESRFFVGAAAFFPLSVLFLLAVRRRPIAVPLAAAAAGAAAVGTVAVASGCSTRDSRWAALIAPVYAVAHGLGMWRGLGLLLRTRLQSSAEQ